MLHLNVTCNRLLQFDARKLETLTWRKVYHRKKYPRPAVLRPSDNWNTTVRTIISNHHHRAIVYSEPQSSSVTPPATPTEELNKRRWSRVSFDSASSTAPSTLSSNGRSNPLMLLGVERLFQYIYFKLRTYDIIDLLSMSINTLDIGTFNYVYSVDLKTSFNEMMAIFRETSVSALPVLNQNGRVH